MITMRFRRNSRKVPIRISSWLYLMSAAWVMSCDHESSAQLDGGPFDSTSSPDARSGGIDSSSGGTCDLAQQNCADATKFKCSIVSAGGNELAPSCVAPTA